MRTISVIPEFFTSAASKKYLESHVLPKLPCRRRTAIVQEGRFQINGLHFVWAIFWNDARGVDMAHFLITYLFHRYCQRTKIFCPSTLYHPKTMCPYSRLMILTGLFLLFCCTSVSAQECTITALLYQDDFSGDLRNWVVEQSEGGTTSIGDQQLEIDGGGTTVWFKERLSGPIMIEYDAVLVQEGGPNDNCRDLNCFWMAIAPRNPADLFDGWRSNSQKRGGEFRNYHDLRTYYAGIGGHKNTTSRFRRYSGHGNRPLLPEHDLKAEEFLLVPNEPLHVRILSCNEMLQYYLNDRLLFDFRDPQPYTYGCLPSGRFPIM